MPMPNLPKETKNCGIATGVCIDSTVIRPQVAADVYHTLRLGHCKGTPCDQTYGVLIQILFCLLLAKTFMVYDFEVPFLTVLVPITNFLVQIQLNIRR